jgi:WD40 repeat protein
MQSLSTIKTGSAPVTALEVSGSLLATGTADSSIRVFKLSETGEQKLAKGIKGFLSNADEEEEDISCLKFTNCNTFLYASCGLKIYVFNLDTKELILKRADITLSHPSITEEINQFVFGSDNTIAIATDSGSAAIFSLKDGELAFLSEIVHENICSGIALKGDSVWSLGMMEYAIKRSTGGNVLNSIHYSDSSAAQMNPPFGNCLQISGNFCAIGRGDARVTVLEFADNKDGELSIRHEYLLVDEAVHSWSICALYVVFC